MPPALTCIVAFASVAAFRRLYLYAHDRADSNGRVVEGSEVAVWFFLAGIYGALSKMVGG